MKTLIPFLLTLVLTACGGGGGGSGSVTESISYQSIQGFDGFTPSLNTGKFDSDLNSYVIATGWLGANSTNPETIAPVKVYKVTPNGLTDATVQILGEEIKWTVNYSIVADFNNDGIDDIFLPGFLDISPFEYKSAFFISRVGQSHRRVTFNTPTYNHGITAGDVDSDGDIDLVSSTGNIWINDGAGNFTFKPAVTTLGPTLTMYGNGVCIADFNNSGRAQVLITDVFVDVQFSPISDTVIFELDANLEPVQSHTLPVPYFDRNNNGLTQTVFGVEYSHDVSCAVTDVNNDGLLDVFVISGYNGGQKRSRMQLYLNQGNFVFVDATDSNIANYNTLLHSTYAPKLIDFNGDGKKDIWLMHVDWENINPNQLWVNNGTGSFSQINDVTNKINLFKTATSADSNYIGPSIPVKINNTWYLVMSSMTNGVLNLAVKTFL